MKTSLIYWIFGCILSLGANIAWVADAKGACVQFAIMALGSFLYGAASLVNELKR